MDAGARDPPGGESSGVGGGERTVLDGTEKSPGDASKGRGRCAKISIALLLVSSARTRAGRLLAELAPWLRDMLLGGSSLRYRFSVWFGSEGV
jgi:hypothetical protein